MKAEPDDKLINLMCEQAMRDCASCKLNATSKLKAMTLYKFVTARCYRKTNALADNQGWTINGAISEWLRQTPIHRYQYGNNKKQVDQVPEVLGELLYHTERTVLNLSKLQYEPVAAAQERNECGDALDSRRNTGLLPN